MCALKDRETLLHSSVICQVKSKLEFSLNCTFTIGHTIPWAFTSWARNLPWKAKYFLIFCSQFLYTWTSGYKGETPPSLDAACCYDVLMYFPSKAIQLTSCDLSSQFPSLQFHCQHWPVPTYVEVTEVATSLSIYCTSFQTLQQSHSHYSCSNLHPEGHFCTALGSAPGTVKESWGYPKCHSSLLNGFAGIPLREILSAHPMLMIFSLCRMKIHKLWQHLKYFPF